MSEEPIPYRPSNSTDGDIFIAEFCSRCTGFFGGHCTILMRMMAFDVEDPEYPKQLVCTDSGPTCTSFKDKAANPPKPRRRIKPIKGQSSLF